MTKPYTIHVEGLGPLIKRMDAFPKTLDKEMSATMDNALSVFEEKVPDYPPIPAGSTYRREFALQKSLTKGGSMNVMKAEKLSNMHQGTFGSNLSYAPYVIGPLSGKKGERQAWMHKNWWWTIEVIAQRSIGKITELFQTLADRLAKFLGGQGK